MCIRDRDMQGSSMEDSPTMPYDEYDDEVIVRRAPSPGIAAVLSVFIAGLGHVYAGRLVAGAIWCAATFIAWWLWLPGPFVHAFCVWSAYQSAKYWDGY
mgnify:CR=1 FL=1